MKNLFFVFVILIYIQNIIYAQELTPEEIFEKSNDAVVVVEAYDINGIQISTGSGVIISDKGLIFTNYHNFEDAESLLFRHNNEYIGYNQVIGVDIDRDILILSTDYKTNNAIQIANIEELKIGNKVYALGSPLGYENSLSDGIIGGLKRTLKELGKTNLIQITANIDHGSSGGAVLNSRGELIGISSYIEINPYGQKSNINFAIPVSDILSVKMVANGDKSVEYYINNEKAKMFFARKDYVKAIHFYTKCIDENNSDINTLIGRGYCYLNSENINAAKNDFERAQQINSNITETHNALGDYYYNIDEFEKSELEFRKSLIVDPNNSYAIYRRGDVYLKLQSYTIAIREYNRAIELSPDNLYIMTQRSIAYFLNGDITNAFSDIDFVIKKEPNNKYALIIKEQYIYSLRIKEEREKELYKMISDIMINIGKILTESNK